MITGAYALVTNPDVATTTLTKLANIASTELEANLSASDMSLQTAALIVLVEDVITASGFVVLGLIMYARRSTDFWGLFVSLWLMVFGMALTTTFGYALPVIWPEYLVGAIVGLVWVGFIYFITVYPTGRFVPSWSRYPFLIFSIIAIASSFGNWFDWESPIAGGIIVSVSFAVLYAQFIRYKKVSTPAQREQTKWLLVAIGAIGLYSLIDLIILPFLAPQLIHSLTFTLITLAIYYLTYIFFVIAISIAILRYRLWDIEVVVNRTLIYGPLSIILAAIFAISIALINQSTRQLFGAEATVTAGIVSALIVATIFQPMRLRLEKSINKRLYPENINLARDLVELSPDMRNLLSVQELAQLVAKRVSTLLNSSEAAVYLPERGDNYRLAASTERHSNGSRSLKVTGKMQSNLEAGRVLSSEPFHLLVPLYVPRLRSKELVGVLGVGLRKNGRGYSSDDKRALVELGGEVGTALYAAQLRTKKKKS